MSTQPEALRLAEWIESDMTCDGDAQIAAELRRLSDENESLRQIVQDFPPVEAELREVSDRAHRLEQQRDTLLEALELAAHWVGEYISQMRAYTISEQADKDLSVIYAAIKAVEGEQT